MKTDLDILITVVSFIWMITFPALVTVLGGILSIAWWLYKFSREIRSGRLVIPGWMQRIHRALGSFSAWLIQKLKR